MGTYIKLPIEIKAHHFAMEMAPAWFMKAVDSGFVEIERLVDPESKPLLKGRVVTLEGIMSFVEGDYIIKGVAGELYPCKPEIFESTYKLVTK